MALRDRFTRRTPLQAALDRSTQPGGNLADELSKLDDDTVRSRADALAICRVLERVSTDASNDDRLTGFYRLVCLFERVDGPDCPAFEVFSEEGNEILVRIVNRALDDPVRLDADGILMALRVLALYGTEEGTDAVLRAAQLPLMPDDSTWSHILDVYSLEHPEQGLIFEVLSDPLPTGFLALCLLDSANDALRGGANCRHPFDSDEGEERLRQWLTDTDQERSIYAFSATAAIPHLGDPGRDTLLALASDHPDALVRLEAAWAAAKLGREDGIRRLVDRCRDVNLADRARHYLTELGREDAIPTETEDASFRARAELARWLAHSNELGRAPDEQEIIDHRDLAWPPEREPKPFWLIRYRVNDVTVHRNNKVGVGLVGSLTSCLFTYKLEQRPPEDCYAIHCYWEMTARKLVVESDVEDPAEYESLLRQSTLEGIDGARIETVVELSPELKYPQRRVALAAASRHGQPGWLVLDGPRSRWYAADEMPPETLDTLVVMVHVGRVLLGFDDEPDRRGFLRQAAPARLRGDQRLS